MERYRLYYWLQVASAVLRRQVNSALAAASDLTATQLGALFYISKHEGCLLKELRDELHLNNSAITSLVARLEKQGLVVRTRSEQDGRAFCLSMAPKGRDAVARALPMLDEMNHLLEQGFSPEELSVVRRFLKLTAQRFSSAPR